MLLKTFIRAIELAAFDARDSIVAGDSETAFLHARDAAHYARLMMRALAERIVEQEGRASIS
jgi:hypothetical protein